MRSRNLEYVVALPPRDVLRRLADRIDEERWPSLTVSGYAGRKPFLGRIRGNRFLLRKRPAHRNGFAPRLTGTVVEDRHGSRITARFRLGTGTRLGIASFYAFLGLFSLVSLASTGSHQALDPTGVVGAGMVGAAGAVLILAGKVLAQPEKRELRGLLDELLAGPPSRTP